MVSFGVAGYPPDFFNSKYKKNRAGIFNWLNDLSLDALEVQMTYGPRTKPENCIEFKRLSEEFGINISIHASYFIVLTSDDPFKITRSIDTLKRTYELAHLMGSDKIILHPGPLYEKPPEMPLERGIENLIKFFNVLGKTEIGLFLETAGKKGQLGSVEEIFKLTKAVNNSCYPCIDFGHVHARTGGTLFNKEGIDSLFNKLKNFGAFDKGSRIHFHYTPIHFGPKGEISHKALADTKEKSNQVKFDLFTGNGYEDDFYHPRFERIVENLSEVDISFTVISEAHNSQEIAAMAMSKYYKEKKLSYV